MRLKTDLSIHFPDSGEPVVKVVASLRSNVDIISVKDCPTLIQEQYQKLSLASISGSRITLTSFLDCHIASLLLH